MTASDVVVMNAADKETYRWDSRGTDHNGLGVYVETISSDFVECGSEPCEYVNTLQTVIASTPRRTSSRRGPERLLYH